MGLVCHHNIQYVSFRATCGFDTSTDSVLYNVKIIECLTKELVLYKYNAVQILFNIPFEIKKKVFIYLWLHTLCKCWGLMQPYYCCNMPIECMFSVHWLKWVTLPMIFGCIVFYAFENFKLRLRITNSNNTPLRIRYTVTKCLCVRPIFY